MHGKKEERKVVEVRGEAVSDVIGESCSWLFERFVRKFVEFTVELGREQSHNEG
jgi:hypothetical protein